MRPIDADCVLRLADVMEEQYKNKYLTPLGLRYMIGKIPTLDVEPVKHGKWKFEPCSKANYMKKETLDGYYHCKECGRRFMRIEGDGWFKRCPECGTIMDGGKTDG